MAVEENIPSAEELALVDPFAEPSAESVLGFPEIQHTADGGDLSEHMDHATSTAVNEMHANKDDHFTYKIESGNKEHSSIPQLVTDVSDEDIWERRLERMVQRKDPNPAIENHDSHDLIAEVEVFTEEPEPETLPYIEVEIPDTSVLDELEIVHGQLKSIGGVSRNEIVTLESILESPGIFGNPRAFSAVHSRAGYNVTMEALGSKIKDIIKDLIRRIIDGCKALGAYILKGLGADFMGQHMTVSLITRRQEVLGQARRIDAVYGLKSFKRMTSATDIPPYKEATSTENFAIRYLDYRTKVRFQNRFTIGMRMIVENSGLSGHVKQLRTEIDRTLQQAEQYVSVLNKNEPSQWGGVDTQFNMGGLNSLLAFWNVKGTTSPSDALAEYREAVNFSFRQEDTGGRRPWEFVKVANYSNPFSDNPNFHRTVGTNIDKITRSLRDLERKVNALDDNGQYNVATGKLMEVQRRLSLVQNMFSLYMSFAKYYESFYQVLAQPLIILSRQMALFRNKEFVTGMMGTESHSVSTENFLLGGADYFDGLMRAQGWKPDSEKVAAGEKVVDNRALACAQQINAQGFDELKDLFRNVYKNSWLYPNTYVDECDNITYLKNAQLIYQPKVVDLEQETPDWGITDLGRQVGDILFGTQDLSKEDPKFREVMDMIWDDERLGARQLLREHAVAGNRGIHYPEVKQKSDIEFLLKHNLVQPTSSKNHPIHDADEGSWVVTSLGMEVANRF